MALTNHFVTEVMKGNIDLSAGTVKVALGGDGTAYTFDKAAHEFLGDVFDGGTTGEELDYTSPDDRVTLTNTAVTQDDTDGEGVFDADDAVFSSLDTTQDIQFVVVYLQVGADDTTPGDDPIVAIYDDDSAGSLADLPKATNGSDVTIGFAAEGIVNISAA